MLREGKKERKKGGRKEGGQRREILQMIWQNIKQKHRHSCFKAWYKEIGGKETLTPMRVVKIKMIIMIMMTTRTIMTMLTQNLLIFNWGTKKNKNEKIIKILISSNSITYNQELFPI